MGRIEKPTMSIAARVLVCLIHAYQRTLAHFIGGRCRFHPSCSEYGLEAIKRHGAVKGTFLGARRLARCHPLGGKGHDPVP